MRRTKSQIVTVAVRLLLTVLVLACVRESQADESKSVTVYKAGQEGYRSFRIPAIVRAHNGDLLAFAEGRKNGKSDHGDIDIVLKRSSDDGQTWGSLHL